MCAVNQHGAGVESGVQNRKKSWLMTLLKTKKRTRLINPSDWLQGGAPTTPRERRFLHPVAHWNIQLHNLCHTYLPTRPEFDRQTLVSSLAQDCRVAASSCLISPAGCVGGPFPSRSREGNSAALAHLQVNLLFSLLILSSLPFLLQELYLSFIPPDPAHQTPKTPEYLRPWENMGRWQQCTV